MESFLLASTQPSVSIGLFGLPPWALFFGGVAVFGWLAFWPAVWFFEYCERHRLFERYRIQKDQYPDPALLQKAHKVVQFNHAIAQWPAVTLYFFLYTATGMAFHSAQLPSWYIVILQVLCFMLVEDTLFYWAHRLFHHRALFRRFHRLHHDFRVSSAVASQYMHPLEFIATGIIPTFSGPLVLLLLGWEVHILTFWIWLVLRILETVDGHSGYELPFWFPHKLLYGSGASVHDYHHAYNKGNFASFFHHWDKLCGTSYQNPKKAPTKHKD
ncbi:MAG: sterol desaturase family protein [Myxococcales bacterium]|nr:sterol desaturase family protein [Myxococcales bacterium]